jgi:pimeloyl-ACP methyl ester carboxylesterase
MTDIAYRTADVDGLTVFYREAGAADAPALVLLHGFPSASHMFRELIPLLADQFHLVAPDLPGFGKSDMPARGDFGYTFEHLADVIDRLTEILGLDRFALYVFDYGAPVGFRIAARHPGAEAFKRDVPDADIRFVPTGHFALETHVEEIATAIGEFLTHRCHTTRRTDRT